MRLIGEIDLTQRRVLATLNDDLARVGLPVVVDAHDLLFADATLVDFLALAATRNPVRLEGASRLLRQLLLLLGLHDDIDIAP